MKVELVVQGQFHKFEQAFAVQHDIRAKKLTVIHAEDDAVIPEGIDVPMQLRMAVMPSASVDSIYITTKKETEAPPEQMKLDIEPFSDNGKGD